VTRDRLYVRGFWGTDEFLLIDTGGLISPSRLAGALPSACAFLRTLLHFLRTVSKSVLNV
jgi:hypothetical protein